MRRADQHGARRRRAAAGTVTAEFALVITLFLAVVCGVVEIARLLYIFNTLQVVTHRAAAAAANADFSDGAAMSGVRQRAIFRASAGTLTLGAPVTDAHIRIDYLALSDAGGGAMNEIPTGSLPSCPANNRVTCMRNPYDSSCIKMVRARICDPADTGQCVRVAYQPMFSFIAIPLSLPTAPAVMTAETLGAPPGQAPCP
ncbi:pilus assembly protein [Oxalobacteraceae bacterium OTU3CAMAD1]|nr:pilus assembly protein [Oxalobacteraceae bacterium OTU3CAMAD1]